MAWRVAGVLVLLAALVTVPGQASDRRAFRLLDTSPRILYSSDWTGETEVFAVDPAGRAPLGQLTFGHAPRPDYGCGPVACGFVAPAPSPNGRWLLYRSVGGGRSPGLSISGALWLARADGSAPRLVASGAGESAVWAPGSSRFAYTADDGVHIVRVRGLRNRLASHSAPGGCAGGVCFAHAPPGCVAWSPDGGSLAFVGWPGELLVWRHGHTRVLSSAEHLDCLVAWSPDGKWIATGERSIDPAVYSYPRAQVSLVAADGSTMKLIRGATPAWSPDGRLLAFQAADGIRVWSLATGRSRRLTGDRGFDLAWAPDGSALAYVQGSITGSEFGSADAASGDIRTVSLSGRVRVVVARDRAYGGQITSLVWTRTPAGVRYRAAVVPDGLFATGPVALIAGDGRRAAFVACHHVFVWTVSETAFLRADPTQGALRTWPEGACPSQLQFAFIYALALAGDRVAWAERWGGLSVGVLMRQTTVGPAAHATNLMRGNGPPELTGLVGSGSLIAFTSFPPDYKSSIFRAGVGGCPCPTLRTGPGLLFLDDSNESRIVAQGENAIVLLDASGAQLLSIPIPMKPKGNAVARLADNDLVVALNNELRDYDATTGTLLHDWRIPSAQHSDLQDAAHGLAAYTLNDQIHLIRLADGKDTTVADGTVAGFMDAGLVYADGARIHLIPYDQLPLH